MPPGPTSNIPNFSLWYGMVVWWLCWHRTILMRNIKQKQYSQFPPLYDFGKPWWGVACTMYDQAPSAPCLGDPVACDRHVVIGRTLAGSMDAVQSRLYSLSHIHVTCGLSAAPCESLCWAIYVNFCSAYQSRYPDAALPIGICESWLFIDSLLPEPMVTMADQLVTGLKGTTMKL